MVADNDAGGITTYRLVQEGEQPVPGGGTKNESYLPVEGGLFISTQRTTLLFDNVSSRSLSFDPSALVKGRHPNRVETLAMSELINLDRTAAIIETQDPEGPIVIPPFSLIRIVWDKN